ncbi:MAG: hypothetical protein CUN52_08135 [Phototrophicales bacterium]|nr:MAG: hypothetical protein CUN52_08135 [Phototrophicales bacterium]
MNKQFARLSLLILILISTIIPVSANSTAQQQPASCPYQQVCELTQQALALLQKYNIPASELDNILRILGTNGVQGVAQYLVQSGMSQEQATAILQEAAPLIEQGMNNSYVQAYIGALVTERVRENELIASRQQAMFASLRNPETVMSILNELGITGQDAEDFLALQQFAAGLGYSPATIDRMAQANAIYQLLGEASDLSDEEKSQLAMQAISDPAGFEAALAEKGVDMDYIYENFEGAYYNFYAELGFDDEAIAKFQELAFAAEVIEAGSSIENMQDLLARYGFLPEEISGLLAGWQGWSSPADIANFLASLGIGWQPEFDDFLDLYESDEYNASLDDWDSSEYMDADDDTSDDSDNNSSDQNNSDNNSSDQDDNNDDSSDDNNSDG